MEKVNVDDLFLCKNCMYMVDEPYESECCGNLYCHNCINELSYTNCSFCKKLFKFRKNIFAKKLMKKVEFKCQYLCGNKFNYDEMKDHLFRCDNKIFKCCIDYCYSIEKKKQMLEHLTTFHANEILIFMENYDEFQNAIEKIKSMPIVSRDNKDDRFKEYISIRFHKYLKFL